MRDAGLEELIWEDLAGPIPVEASRLGAKPMFGGLCWMFGGHLLCAARHDGLLVRLGKGQTAWATELPDIEPMINGTRPMPGWVWCGEAAYGDDAVRRRLIQAAVDFVQSLPER